MNPSALRVAVMITTRNRCADLARTCAVLEALAPAPVEVLITADECTDGTEALLASKSAPYRIFSSPQRRGSIPNRDAMLRASPAEIVLSLDDDSYPLEPDAIMRLQTLFAGAPRLAVASFPQRTDEFPETLTATDFGPPQLLGSYASSGAALRREAYLALGGYETAFGHAYEEPDFALRCQAAGWEVRSSSNVTIRHHFTGAQRNEIRTHHLHACNEFWSILLRCPAPYWIAVALFRAVRQFGYACSRGPGWVCREPLWWARALFILPQAWRRRAPLPWPAYLAWMRRLRHPAPATESETISKVA